MTNELPRKCPACAQDLHVRMLRCPVCQTEVQGDFLLGRFSLLSPEQLVFLETFIRYRGSLKDVGAALGISYPTARNRLDGVIEALGFDHHESEADRRMEILNRLKDGELTAEEALLLLQGGNSHE